MFFVYVRRCFVVSDVVGGCLLVWLWLVVDGCCGSGWFFCFGFVVEGCIVVCFFLIQFFFFFGLCWGLLYVCLWSFVFVFGWFF